MSEVTFEEFKKAMGGYVDSDLFYWLRGIKFFDAPASIGHHGAETGGLYNHSRRVTEALVRLTKKLGLEWQLDRSPYVVGMFHDLCKVDDYSPVTNSIGEFQGLWERNKHNLMPGHGDKSIMMINGRIDLTTEEVMCIRWHMGAFDKQDNWEYYTCAVRQYPNVLFTHTADMIASQIDNV